MKFLPFFILICVTYVHQHVFAIIQPIRASFDDNNRSFVHLVWNRIRSMMRIMFQWFVLCFVVIILIPLIIILIIWVEPLITSVFDQLAIIRQPAVNSQSSWIYYIVDISSRSCKSSMKLAISLPIFHWKTNGNR